MEDRREKELLALVDGLRRQLAMVDPRALAERCGVEFDAETSEFEISVFGHAFVVPYPSFVARDLAVDHHEGSPWLQALLMYYFRMADGAPLEGTWRSLRELPGGLMYERAFQGYSGDKLARAFGNDVELLARAAKLIKGTPISLGDSGYCFWALPRVPLGLAYWVGDEEVDAAAKVLFDSSAVHYLPIDALAALGGRLCNILIKTAGLPLDSRPDETAL
ncbi:MAG: DUF3786 domain-containing protein [Chloroflexi bacterium]|nr:DUF3786 domain-containing protein [Chloroflexota bacterium]